MQPNRHIHEGLVYTPTTHTSHRTGLLGCSALRLRVRLTWHPRHCWGPACGKPLWSPLLLRHWLREAVTWLPLHQPSWFPHTCVPSTSFSCASPGQGVQGHVCEFTLQDPGLGANERGCPQFHTGVSVPELGLAEPKPSTQHASLPRKAPSGHRRDPQPEQESGAGTRVGVGPRSGPAA